MESRATRGVGSRGRRVGAVRAAIEGLESRRLMSVTNLIEGASQATNPVAPADPNGAVSATHLVDAVNTELQWFTKAGTLQHSEQFTSFFAPLGTTVNTFMSDPHVVYDQFADRFIVCILSLDDPGQITGTVTNQSHVLMAVSKTADPNDGFYFQSINTKISANGTEGWLDYPGLSVSPDAIFLTGNMFAFSGATSGVNPETESNFLGSRLWIIPKNPLYTGGQSALSQPTGYDPLSIVGVTLAADDPNQIYRIVGASRLAPAQMYATDENGTDVYPTGLGTYLTFDAGKNEIGHNLIGVIRVDNPLGVVTFTKDIIDVGFVDTKAFNSVPQPWDLNQFPAGPYPKLDAIDERIMNAVWRDGFLYATQEVVPFFGPDSAQVTAHWYKFDTGDRRSVAPVKLEDQGNVGGEDIGIGVQTFFPSISVNARGDMAIGFSAAGPLHFQNNQITGLNGGPPIYGGAYVTARLVDDPKGTTRKSEVLAAGQELFLGPQGEPNASRWGDYSGIWLDPADEQTFWAFNMYANVQGQWATRWGKFLPTLVDLPAVEGTVWDDQNGDGVRQDNEPGLQWATLRVFDGVGNLISTTRSDVNGHYVLQGPPTGGLALGTPYTIVIDISGTDTTGRQVLQGYTFSPPNKGTDDKVDSDFIHAVPSSFQATFPLTITMVGDFASELIQHVDAGLFKPIAVIAPLTQSVDEGGQGAIHLASFVVNLIDSSGNWAPSPWLTSLFYTTESVSATSDVDYRSHINDLIQILPGEGQSPVFTVEILGDNVPEGDETFRVQLRQPSEVLGVVDTSTLRPEYHEDVATVTIKEDDKALLTVDAGPTVAEPGPGAVTYALFTLRLSVPNPTRTSVVVPYKLIDLTAKGGARGTAGADYDNTAGTVTFAPGQLTKTVRIPVFGDGGVKEKNEKFQLQINYSGTQFVNGTTDQQTSTATIVDAKSQKMLVSAGKTLRYTDVAGNHVTITLTGPGKGSVVVASGGMGRQLTLSGTTERSVLTIRTDRGQTVLSGIDVDGGLALLDAPTTNVVGDISSALGTIRNVRLNYLSGGNVSLDPSPDAKATVTLDIRRITDATLNFGSPIRTFNLASWVDTGPVDTLTAPSAGEIHATGDFGADVMLTDGDLQSLVVDGMLRGSTVSVTRDVNGQTLGTIGTVRLGSAVKSRIEAGARVNSLQVRRTFSNTEIQAPRIGTLDLGTVRNTKPDVLVAAKADKIQRVSWVFKGKARQLTDLDTPGDRSLDGAGNIVLRLT